MKTFISTSVLLTLTLLALSPRSGGANLILARDTDYYALDTQTGLETYLATGSLDTVVNLSFVVNSGIAYQGGFIGGRMAITTTNLTSGATQDFIMRGGFFRNFGGFHNGDLIFARDADYYAFDPRTGSETFLATGSLDTVLNFSLVVDSGIAYQGGRIRGLMAITATDLANGTTQDFIMPGGFFRDFGGFHNGDLIFSRNADYYAFDPQTGSETFLATGSLDTVLNYSLVVDSGIAYQGGEIRGRMAVTATDLTSGATRDYILRGGFFHELGGLDPLPEPASSTLLIAGILVGGLQRRRDGSSLRSLPLR